MIDTISKESHSLPFTFGDALTKEQLTAREYLFSRIHNDNKFIYSFYIEPDIFITQVSDLDFEVEFIV